MRVLVIGLHKQQLEKLCKSFPKLNLSGLCAQDRHKVASTGSYDFIISVTKFTNHSTEHNYSKHKGYIRIRNGGGCSSVKNMLNTILERGLSYG